MVKLRNVVASLSFLCILGVPTMGFGTGEAPSTHVTFWQSGDSGDRLFLRGRVLNHTGRPLNGATIWVWQADGSGSYHDERYRAVITAGEQGEFSLSTAVPGQYWGAKHVHFVIRAEGYGSLDTRVLFKGDTHVDAARTDDLVILLEETRKDGELVYVGGVEFRLNPAGGS